MFTKLKTITMNKFAVIAAVSALLVVSLGVGFSPMASAQVNPQTGVCTGAKDLKFTSTPTSGNCTDTTAETSVNKIVTTVINIFSVVVGIVAVIMIIIGGLKYITSGGDSSKVTSAKNSIIYAIIGLVIVALAQVIVRFVLAKSV